MNLGHYAKGNKSVTERQVLYDLTHMWNLQNNIDEHKGRGKRERDANHKRFLTIENKLRVDGGWWVSMG